MRPLLELCFFIPFSISDSINGAQFAKNIVKIGLVAVSDQCAKYMSIKTNVFLDELNIRKKQGCKGPFLTCTENMWNELVDFASNTLPTGT